MENLSKLTKLKRLYLSFNNISIIERPQKYKGIRRKREKFNLNRREREKKKLFTIFLTVFYLLYQLMLKVIL